jgi:hypothetical protein
LAQIPTSRQSLVSTESRRAPAWALIIICLGAVVCAVVFAIAVVDANTEMLNGLTVGVVLVGLTVPIAFRIARLEHDATLVGIVLAGVTAKMLGALLRYYMSFEFYARSDSSDYHRAALALAPDFRAGIFDPGISLSGTNFIRVVSGAVYALFGVSRVSAFFVFSWMAFIGLVLLTRAFRIAIPEGNYRRYLIVILFLPSLLYWPSSMGKEAWMMLGIGLSALGIACILRGRTTGVVHLVLGLLVSGIVRPHIALLLFMGLVFALLVRRAPARTYAAPLFRLLGIVLLAFVGMVLVGETASFLGQPSLTTETVSETLSSNEVQTADGGSEFTPVTVDTPIDMAPALVTILVRPFLWETSTAQGLLSAAEGILIVALIASSWRRIRAAPRLFRTRPYIAFCTAYVLMFVYAFSSFSNFGILARQRVQMLPFLLVFIALPEYKTVPSLRSQRAKRRRPTPAHTGTAPTRRRVRRPIEEPAASA